MRYPSRGIAQTAALGCCALLISIAAPSAPSLADDATKPDAASGLDAMSSYLGGLKSFGVAYDVDMDVISDDAEKLQFTSSFVSPQGAKELSEISINETGELVGANP